MVNLGAKSHPGLLHLDLVGALLLKTLIVRKIGRSFHERLQPFFVRLVIVPSDPQSLREFRKIAKSDFVSGRGSIA